MGLGDNEHTLEWLERACEERETRMIHLHREPIFDPLHSDSHFQDLLRRIGVFSAPKSEPRA